MMSVSNNLIIFQSKKFINITSKTPHMASYSEKLKLIVHIHWLLILGGITWTLVGIMLARLAFIWFTVLDKTYYLIHSLIGITLGIISYFILFSHVAQKNVKRIIKLNPKAPLHKFQELKGYILIIFMIGLGIFLRTTGILPRQYLGIIYLTIGLSLFLGSFHYYHATWKIKTSSSPFTTPTTSTS